MAKKGRRQFGGVRRLPSKRWQAYYTGPDEARHTAVDTFDAKQDATDWLIRERELAARPDWVPPKLRRAEYEAGKPPTLATYADTWVATRVLKPRTRALYRRLLDDLIVPGLGSLPLDEITAPVVRNWHAVAAPGAPTRRAHAYQVLHTIMGTAVTDQLITVNPCTIRGGGSSRTVHRADPATLDQLATIVEHMPERLRLSVMIAAWCGLRLGENFELRRGDVDLVRGVLRVRRAVSRVPGEGPIVGSPKGSDAGVRDVTIPPHLMPEFVHHLENFVPPARDSLLFRGRDSGQQLATSTLYRWYYPAREAAGRPDLRWHDLRHTGATLAAATGATLAELMNRLGHSTVAAAMRYQHAAQDRDRVIAQALSDMATRGE
ncbi:tyrosine-type recombinase/integrase [Microlunatus sp. Y2014]|uniref:tyrosine-type recombinase/integrase n=1 Tax=Microlunatus sp. Y2014 TaxID=3418488 RepID=UPI003DA6DFBC